MIAEAHRLREIFVACISNDLLQLNWPLRPAGRRESERMRILVVEDSEPLSHAILKGLRSAGHAVDTTVDGGEAVFLASSNPYDVIVLDLMLPTLDGLSVLRKLRVDGNNAHVLLLTAKDSLDDRITGLRAGADDYLIKPFAFDELLARVEALGRRSSGSKNPHIRVGRVEIDTVARLAMKGGAPVMLTPREYAVLHFLATQRGKVMSRSDIEAHTYDGSAEPMSNVIDAVICSIRRKLEDAGAESIIRTRRGMGYFVAEEVQ